MSEQPVISAIHPGLLLERALKEQGINQRQLSIAIGKPTSVINDILHERRSITPEIAYLLEAVIVDYTAEDWLTYQALYDLAQVKQKDEIVQRRESIDQWNQLKEIINPNYLKKRLGLSGSVSENVNDIYKFFGNTSIEGIRDRASRTAQYFHKSTRQQTDLPNMMTWMLIVRKTSNEQTIANQFDINHTAQLIKDLNYLFYCNKNTIHELTTVLNKYGIKFVSENNLEKTPIDGYSFWEGDNPTIAVTQRYNRIDNLAFAVLHELGHIVKHLSQDKTKDYVDSDTPNNDDFIEKVANDFASNALKGNAPLDDLFREWQYAPFGSRRAIINASEQYKINRGIITGQFQHYCHSYAICRDLLDPIN